MKPSEPEPALVITCRFGCGHTAFASDHWRASDLMDKHYRTRHCQAAEAVQRQEACVMSGGWCPLHDGPANICGGPHPGVQCQLCGNIGPPDTLLQHLRDHGVSDRVETWPDGGVVIYDETGDVS